MILVIKVITIFRTFETMTSAERQYLETEWPSIRKLQDSIIFAEDSGANTEARWYRNELKKVQQPAEAALLASGTSTERRLYLERLTIYSSRRWWGSDAARFWNSLNHTRFLQTLARST